MYQVDFTKPCHAHFMGIGGISMSGLAEILNKEGFTISGSDMKESAVTKSLEAHGMKVLYGQVASNITSDIDFIVYTAAIHPDNAEYVAALAAGIPMMTRAELLGQIMEHYKYSIAVAGTHGKTTTTAMVSEILLAAAKDPTISIGGILDSIQGNIRVGSSPYFVTEACEYTNSYHSFFPMISIILNIDNDHLDFFKNIENIVASFTKFAGNTKDGGILILNGDMKYRDQVKTALEGRRIKLVTFGFQDGNDYQAKDIRLNELGQPTYTLIVKGENRGEVSLSVTGEHNAMNSLSAIAAADFLELPFEKTLEGLRKSHSAERRFQYKGTLDPEITIIDDYAHHPTEIAASIKVAKSIVKGELWCAFQPHTYSRTKAHLEAFADALSPCDHVLLADIYAAREVDDGSISSKDLAEKLVARGCHAIYLGSFDKIEKYFKENVHTKDMLITMGAGNIDSVGTDLLQK